MKKQEVSSPCLLHVCFEFMLSCQTPPKGAGKGDKGKGKYGKNGKHGKGAKRSADTPLGNDEKKKFIKCFSCGELGHVKSECPKLKKEQE